MRGFIRLGNLLAVTGVLGSTVGTSLLIGPLSSHSPAHSPSVAVTLPLTGVNFRSRGANQGTDQQPVAVYSPVILSIARSHGVPNAYGGEGFSPSTIYAELAARHPVQVWMEAQWSRPAVRTWTAWDGRRIRYSLAEHSVILTGVSATMVR